MNTANSQAKKTRELKGLDRLRATKGGWLILAGITFSAIAAAGYLAGLAVENYLTVNTAIFLNETEDLQAMKAKTQSMVMGLTSFIAIPWLGLLAMTWSNPNKAHKGDEEGKALTQS